MERWRIRVRVVTVCLPSVFSRASVALWSPISPIDCKVVAGMILTGGQHGTIYSAAGRAAIGSHGNKAHQPVETDFPDGALEHVRRCGHHARPGASQNASS